MGRRGPPPSSAKVLALHGERRPSQVGREPQPPEQPPRPPEYLGDEAREVWAWAIPHLEHMGFLYAVDSEVLATWCDAVVHRRRFARLADQSAPLIRRAREGRNEHDRAELIANPAHRELRLWSDRVVRYGAELGLSPRGRRELAFLAMAERSDPRAALLS